MAPVHAVSKFCLQEKGDDDVEEEKALVIIIIFANARHAPRQLPRPLWSQGADTERAQQVTASAARAAEPDLWHTFHPAL